MSSSSLTTNMTDPSLSSSSGPRWKNIIVIGASVAGHSVVNGLAQHLPSGYRILLIERNAFVHHNPCVVRSLVRPGWDMTNFTAPVRQDTIFPAGSRHRVVAPNRVVKLRRTSVWLEQPFEGADEVDFEICILATGAQSPAPIRPMPGCSLDDWRTALRRVQDDIASAHSVLIVGGGSVGIEVAGEITDAYPNKRVTIVHWDVGLLHPSDSGGNTAHTYVPPRTPNKLRKDLESQLRARGIKLQLKDGVDFEAAKGSGQWGGMPGPLGGMRTIPLVSGGKIEADYVFNSTGNRPNSDLVRWADPGSLTTNGYVSVDSYFRVRTRTPNSPLVGHYYAIGDVCNSPSWKTAEAAIAEGDALARIIVTRLRGMSPTPYSPPGRLLESTVLLGSGGGASIRKFPIIGYIRSEGSVREKSHDFHAGKNFFSRFRGQRRFVSTSSWSLAI
ncbi:hypothetical protein CcaverHIS641_0607040 [Cutaneotrichosporon cavernicola]|nr:hypothetical protein CcaverHIS641_0607040 [Cutaneotrichosporon cavernicola]